MQKNYNLRMSYQLIDKAFFVVNEFFYSLIKNEKAYIIDVSCVLRRLLWKKLKLL
jgi:hypothetical protein